MGIVRITENDIRKMVESAVRAVLKESVDEKMGSALGGKSSVIKEIIDKIADFWNNSAKQTLKPESTGSFKFKDGNGGGTYEKYTFKLPNEILEPLDLAEDFLFVVNITDYTVPDKYLSKFGGSGKATEGSTNFHPLLLKLAKPSFKFKISSAELKIPAFNGVLQTEGVYPSMYHELSHVNTNLQIGLKSGEGLNTFTAKKTKVTDLADTQHAKVMRSLNDDGMVDFMRRLQFGSDYEYFRKINFIFYSIWEITEKNARAESMYGDMQALGITRDTFKEKYPKTETYRTITELSDMIKELENAPDDSSIWQYAADIMKMNPRYEGVKTGKFLSKVKERFISHSKELLEELRRKAMKVAEYYLQQNEPKQGLSRLERYKKEKEEKRKVQNFLNAIFGQTANRGI